ncbi:hypothetical protein EVG20_g4926 [Dentipellis fragilis]|uniref:HNH nuclease domain-containing protein n=1 Tax=Dentipellis fragilis TaxID=205917 RepID=A0A4Y9YVC1_9AGAM|nr:hypothetical protein EVG20_g4926 [Dentipellis fragilis]
MYRTASDLNLTSGARYVSAAVCACAALAAGEPKDSRSERLAAELSGLGGTWVAYMLWPFVLDKDQPEELREHSSPATPTIDNTFARLVTGIPGHRAKSFGEQASILLSQATYIADSQNIDMRAKAGTQVVQLEAAHIFKRSVTVLPPPSHDSAGETNPPSSYATFDILKHYCQLDAEAVSQMDGAHNGMLLDHYAHQAFDRFDFCFMAEEKADTYKIKHQHLSGAALQRLSPCDHPRPGQGIPLPSPNLLQLHAALSGVLHMSGAADMLQIFNNPPDSGGPAVCSGQGEDFMHEVIEYDGNHISRLRDVTEVFQGLRLNTSHSQVS